MDDLAALPTLLSQVLIAFTIELDNEAELRAARLGPRRTFPVSLVMWSNLMRFVGDDGVAVREIPDRVGVPGTPVTSSWIHGMLAGMERWGYIVVAPDPADERAKPPRRDLIVRPAPGGRAAQEVWRPLVGEVEERWKARFGTDAIESLRSTLLTLVDRFDLELPHYLPVVTYADGMFAALPRLVARRPDRPRPVYLPALLSQVLLVFTVELERGSDVSLAVGANALRVLDEQGVRVRDLPGMTGVSKEAISASLGFLQRRGHAVVEPDPTAARGKRARLTPKGLEAQRAHRRRLDDVEARWQAQYGGDAIAALRAALLAILDGPDGEPSRIAQGLAVQPANWRATKPYAVQTEAFIRDPRRALPHHPMVLHRGGWPDGS